jgi:predicted CopG family antitoxin
VRTTIAIDDDVFFAVKAQARSEHRSAGDVISDLVRQALTNVDHAPTKPAKDPREERLRARGFNPLPRRGGVVTNDLVNQLREDLNL